ncbi:MAG: hypothetical protein KUG77_06440 [Nannocystaceae bacterium]|nr:hypothetical protein [Nannocystaceae bacterium]
MLKTPLLPLLAFALVSTAASSAEAADSWRIKRQVWSNISFGDSDVFRGLFSRSLDFVGGRVSTNYGARLSPVCRTSDGKIGGATPQKTGNTWQMKCLGKTYAQGARALKFKNRYSAESDTFTKARGRLPQRAVKVNSGGKVQALCLAKLGSQNVPGVMDIPSVHSTAPLPPCKIWVMGQLTGIGSWSIITHKVTLPTSANTWWNPGRGDNPPQLPTYVLRSGPTPMCRSHEVFGSKWPGMMRKSTGPNGLSVYCDFTYLDASGTVKQGKTPSFEVYLASNPTKPAFPKWGPAKAGTSANYSRGLEISSRNGKWLYMCSQTHGKRGFSVAGDKKCRAVNGSAAREGHFRLLER